MNGTRPLRKARRIVESQGRFREAEVVDGDSLYLLEFFKNLISWLKDPVGEIEEGFIPRSLINIPLKF